MAPIPEDNQEKPPPRDEEVSAFANGNEATITFSSDSSDNEDNYPDAAGYMLLPQDPTVEDDDSDNEIIGDGDNSNVLSPAHVSQHATDGLNESDVIGGCDSVTANNCSVDTDSLPDEVIQSEGVAAAPTMTTSNLSNHPEFLAKFPDRKIPSYMQVPDLPSKSNSNDVLWNKKRSEKSLCLDTEDNKIMKAMSGFSLPSENVPDWAKNMSEDQWNNVITQQIEPSHPQPKSDNLHQKEQTSSSSSGRGEQNQADPSDWVAEFSDS